MSTKIGRFEVLSEITHSPIGAIYKASDPENGQTVALKTIKLELLGEQGAALVQSILEEAETTKVLNSHNIALLYGAGDIDGLFCAALEYVQGNSISTMLARKEGFSIWDLQDIVRQTCQGLDHAHSHHVVHYSLEPAKIMVTWDGTVKVLGFGISAMGAPASQASGAPPEVLHYMSPEQLRGDPLDARSNVFSLGAILYEMVTERKAFSGEDADQVRQSILEMTPVAPDQINRKTHPVLSQVIMKALAKAPDERYQSGQDLVNDLERCKESATKTAAKKPAQPPQGLITPQKQKPAPAVAAPVAAAPPKPVAKTLPPKVEVASVMAPPKPAAPQVSPQEFDVQPPAEISSMTSPEEEKKAAAAAAGWSGSSATSVTEDLPRVPKLDPSEQFISSCVKASMEAATRGKATMSSATVEPEFETAVETPKITIDPMMAEVPADAPKHASFSEIDELPPLKEVFIAPPPPPSVPEPVDQTKATLFIAPREPEKPKIQPREVAKKAVKEIKKTPPKLFGYAIAGAVGVILLVIVVIAFRIHNQDSDDDSTPTQSAAATESAQPSAAPAQAAPQAAAVTPAPVPVQAAEPITAEPPAAVSVKPKFNPRKKAARTSAPAPQTIPGQLAISSTPEGAQVHIDGRVDPSWVTPYTMPGLTPGSHVVTVSKAGYSTETRTLEVASGSKSFLVVQLAGLTAGMSVGSEPAGALVFLDGKDTGRVTPTQLAVDKPGNHSLTIKKQGYLDETTTANLQAGQTFHFAPALRALGNTNEIKTAGKFKKMFGGGGDTTGMGTVSVKTQPKGAQIAVNNRMLDKNSPVEFYLNPGTYMVDITASGFKSIHRVVNVDKGGKVAIDEVMERE
ncbi:MAG: PEGA domain-containing protein [Acidobacteriia bacterium]|nr:PEGA domain-containing protein [Terriglobia bacterium]